ncbi:MAG: alginate export family protein [Tannerellaceae bacterium]|nr:alginate export family protein [Tannerellaceae bacterium]
MKRISSIILGLLLCLPMFSQDNDFSLGVQIRPRAEYRNGAISPHADGAEAAGFINSRSRITMDYRREKLAVGVSAQHVGVWGQDPQIDKNGRFMLNEAWASLHSGTGLFLKLGRQSLVYDDDRILGSLDWNTSGRFHDALKMGYENPNNKLHLILAFNQNDEKVTGGTYYAPGAQPYKAMQTLWYQYIANKSFNLSFLLMNLGLESGNSTDQKTVVKNLQTLGTNISWQPGALQLYGTFYYQAGKTVADKDVDAWMAALNASYSFTPAWKITLATDYLSGNDGKDPDAYTAFNPLYGTHHKFYGTMDYFYASPFAGGLNPGLWDNQIGIAYKASPKVTLMLNYHNFQSTTDIFVAEFEQEERDLGSEIDFQINWNVMKDVSFMGGYSRMFGSEAMKVAKGGDPSKAQDWIWVSLNVNPKVFVSKWR